MTTDSAALECHDLAFAYGRNVVLNHFSFALGRGITGLLGPNGAGKSTLLAILATVRRPMAGDVAYGGTVPGAPIAAVRRQIGYLPQRFDLMTGSTCLDNVAYAAWCNGVDARLCLAAAKTALGVVNLQEKAKTRVRALSGGQKQRLGIACAIAHGPAVILLDEPTAGLDPAQRVDLRGQLLRIASSACVLISTHLVEDLVAMRAGVIVIDRGHRLFQGALLDMVGPDAGIDALAVEAAYLALVNGEDI